MYAYHIRNLLDDRLDDAWTVQYGVSRVRTLYCCLVQCSLLVVLQVILHSKYGHTTTTSTSSCY